MSDENRGGPHRRSASAGFRDFSFRRNMLAYAKGRGIGGGVAGDNLILAFPWERGRLARRAALARVTLILAFSHQGRMDLSLAIRT